MYKLNHLQYPTVQNYVIDEKLSLQPLKNNFEFDKMVRNFKMKYNFEELYTFSFSADGFLALMLNLTGKIAVSLGESQAIISAATKYQSLGFDITFISLTKEGNVDFDSIKKSKFDYIFVSPYVMDTFVKTDLKKLKKLKSFAKTKIISNLEVEKCLKQIEKCPISRKSQN